MEIEWSDDQCLQLIGAYERQPILWKPSYPNHFSKNKKKDAWQAISREIGIDEDNIRQKMMSLLGSFRQQKSKGKRSIGTGKARHEVYRSKWFAFKRMHFLMDKNQPRRTVNTHNVSKMGVFK
ncbi:uncharacterized protein LOC143378062 [Andrena cerasifolii]|uniref:uncharacterized protein LOC143378062 n=1 Tax=Andrena cerasifolii TaxID=2819439 RepID=UPI00403785DD